MNVLLTAFSLLALCATSCPDLGPTPTPAPSPSPTDPVSQTNLVAFYSTNGVDDQGRTLQQYLTLTDEQLANPKDYIGWMFPIDRNTLVIPGMKAPTWTPADASKPVVQANLRKSLDHLLGYYRIQLKEVSKEKCSYTRNTDFSEHLKTWVENKEHNDVVMPRVYNSLWMSDQPELANCFYKVLIHVFVKEAKAKPAYLVNHSSPGITFYLDQTPNDGGDTISVIHKYDYAKLEGKHNFIQWIFWTNKPSTPNPLAPIMTPFDVVIMRHQKAIDPKFDPINKLVAASFKMMAKFYGFTMKTNSPCTTTDNKDIKERFTNFTTHTHNYPRVTRILESLDLMGAAKTADCTYKKFEAWYLDPANKDTKIGAETYRLWTQARDLSQTAVTEVP